jgi:hydrogenase maturation protease
VTDSILVVGYGNPLRRDDGVGQRVARMVAALKWPGVRTLAVQQLTPELAEPLAEASIAIFVDAAAEADEVVVEPIGESCGSRTMAHTGDPAWLLGLARATYGRRPPAWLVAVPARDMGYGTGFSSMARSRARDAVKIIGSLLQRTLIQRLELSADS